MGDQCVMGEVSQEETFGCLEDDLDAFNDETFGGSGDKWEEGDHEQLAVLTEQERMALKQSDEFFQFGSDGEELGGEMEDALEPELQEKNGDMGQRLESLSLQEEGGRQPPHPLAVQTAGPPPPSQQLHHQQLPPQHLPSYPPQQGAGLYIQQQLAPLQAQRAPPYPLLPPSHFTGPPVSLHDPAIMSLNKLPPPPHFPLAQQQPPQYMPHPPPIYHPQGPTMVPGLKTLADIEAEILYGSRPPPGPPPVSNPVIGQHGPRPTIGQHVSQQPPQTVVGQSGQVGHINPAVHNLNYPGMRDRQNQPPPPMKQQTRPQQHQKNILPPPHVVQQAPPVLQQVRQQTPQHKADHPHDRRQASDYFSERKNDFYNEPKREEQFHSNRRNDYYSDRRANDFYQNDRHYNHDQRKNEGGWREKPHYDNANRNNRHTFGEYFEQAARRDLMPGHVHTLGILRYSRSRNDRERSEDGLDDCLDEGEGILLANPTGDPILDAKMMEEQAELARKRAHYASSEDEYAGLMSQRDKQWIINIQLNQLKCDNPYADDYYYTMFQAKKQAASSDETQGGQLLLNESVIEASAGPGYKPTQFENSLGKLQVVTVKAPRQIIDLGVVRSLDSPVGHQGEGSPAPGAVVVEQGNRKVGGEYKQVLIQIEILYMTLLDLETDQLKLTALPTGAPLREQVSQEEEQHLYLLQAGLSRSEWLSDCLSVSKGRTLVLRALPHLASSPIYPSLLDRLLGLLHLVARGDGLDAKFWAAISRHISNQSLACLEVSVKSLINLKAKVIRGLLMTNLGATVVVSLLVKASSQENSLTCNDGISLWSQLASILLASSGSLGKLLSPLDLKTDTLDPLLPNMDPQQREAWAVLMANITNPVAS